MTKSSLKNISALAIDVRNKEEYRPVETIQIGFAAETFVTNSKASDRAKLQFFNECRDLMVYFC